MQNGLPSNKSVHKQKWTLGKWSMSSVSTITAHPHSSRHTQTASRAVEMECGFQSFITKRKSW